MSDANVLACLHEDLLQVWNADTSDADPERWATEHPSTGQCTVTVLIVNAVFGGRIVRADLGAFGTHYANLIELDGVPQFVDLTADQFEFTLDWKHSSYQEPTREEMCANDHIFRRFQLLSSLLLRYWEGLTS